MDWAGPSSPVTSFSLQFDVIAYWNVLGWMIVEADPPKRDASLRNHE